MQRKQLFDRSSLLRLTPAWHTYLLVGVLLLLIAGLLIVETSLGRANQPGKPASFAAAPTAGRPLIGPLAPSQTSPTVQQAVVAPTALPTGVAVSRIEQPSPVSHSPRDTAQPADPTDTTLVVAPTEAPTSPPTATDTPTATPTATDTPPATPTATVTVTATPSPTPTIDRGRQLDPTGIALAESLPRATGTLAPRRPPTNTPTAAPTVSATNKPLLATDTPEPPPPTFTPFPTLEPVVEQVVVDPNGTMVVIYQTPAPLPTQPPPPTHTPKPPTSQPPTFTPQPPTAVPTATRIPRYIALQAGHWQASLLPDELAYLRENGAAWGNVTEWQVNLTVAHNAAALLRDRGYVVEVISATVPTKYKPDLFIALHSDSSDNPKARGFKAAIPAGEVTTQNLKLLTSLYQEYEAATGLPREASITYNMTEYYAFGKGKGKYAVNPDVPQGILEMGYISSSLDRKWLLEMEDSLAYGVANAVDRYYAPDPTPVPKGKKAPLKKPTPKPKK